jgi:NADH-quinone oxidoreductase subunit N
LFLGFLRNRQILFVSAIFFMVMVFIANLLDWNTPISFGDFINKGMMRTDNISVCFTAILLLTSCLILPLSNTYIQNQDAHTPEYYAILFFSLVGAIMMVSYENLIMLFIGVETLSVSMYILAGADKRNIRSNEAALKYLLMGAFATGILLFGFALLYGATGHFTLTDIGHYISLGGNSPMLYLGLMMTLIGVLFKVSAAPFHFWTPDVYEGSPTLFTAFMSTIVKTAGFASLYKLLSSAFSGIYDFWLVTLLVITALTLIIGNVTAVFQKSFKRMMAYSSISHAGYMLIAVVTFSANSTKSILFYSLAYSLATISAFGVLMLVSDKNKQEDYDNFNGLGKTNPFLAIVMPVSMLSLAGIPLTAGFLGKLLIFIGAYEQGFYGLMILAALMSTIGIYYYFRVIIAMYLKPNSEREKINVSTPYIVALLLTTLLSVGFGLFPDVLLGFLK